MHDKDLCIGCGYCFYACPFGAPQYPQQSAFGVRGKMDKCTFCAGGPLPDNSDEEYAKYGSNRIAEGKLPLCAEMCSTKADCCGYCFYACPFGAPQYPQQSAFGVRGKMDKCTFCAGGPLADNSDEEFAKYGSNRIAEGKLPLCAEMCSTKALLAGDGDLVADIYRQRVIRRGGRPKTWGWETAYPA